MKGRVLVAGFATRHVVRSVYAAGYEVCAIDHFCDQDLTWYTKEHQTFEELAELPEHITDFCSRYTFDCIVTTSGAEDMDLGRTVCGTPRDVAARFCTKTGIQQFFEEHGFPVPPLLPEGEYPAFIKPDTGAGGWRNTFAASPDDEAAWTDCWPDTPYIRQMPVEGIPCSVSCIADGTSARALSLNRQFNRGGEGERRFGFAGAVTPFQPAERESILTLAEDIAAKSGCIGSLGIDFMLTDDGIRTIEINPRFQATLDIVEMSTGANIFEMHRNAASGILPASRPGPVMTAVRSIIFADRDCVVTDDLKSLHPDIADIPWVGTEIEEGGAVLSVYGRGADEAEALAALDKTITRVYRYMSRW
ncbi:ATP-grasp domain-containing protein [Methanogenium sp. S4BF]|uniref:ATP-grasp domain-containing protein n=1 Tax=Methanogenium sp. S4BF TaxID=1789226 RepID=UPI0024175BCA|nr:ATP-grasp domain-containing protein [Methanogenium sp. S4BF]WFN34905.1 ATP-grasp domain-containing protein [Methanogenium sp. S4BF]